MNSGNLSYKVEVTPFDKEIRVPTSKSYANRLLVLAAISKEPTWVRDLPASTDVINMLNCFKQLGLEIERSGEDVLIKNSFPECENDKDKPLELETGDGGTTNRFIIPFLARGSRPYFVLAEGGMRSRPMNHLEDAIRSLGAAMDKGSEEDPYWYKIQGPCQSMPNSLEVDSSISTQFPTGVALAFADTSLTVTPKNLQSSRAYYDMTLTLIEQFREGKRDFIVPVDFSSLGYPLALALVAGKVTVKNCHEIDEFQADSAFFDIIKLTGGSYRFSGAGLTVEKNDKLKGFNLDCSKCPDLVPTLGFVAAYANGESRLQNLEVLRHKESDRITEVINVLQAFNVSFEYDDTLYELLIRGGNPSAEFVEYSPPADHRIIMMAYLFMRMNKGGKIHEAQHVAKSFPGFFETLGV